MVLRTRPSDVNASVTGCGAAAVDEAAADIVLEECGGGRRRVGGEEKRVIDDRDRARLWSTTVCWAEREYSGVIIIRDGVNGGGSKCIPFGFCRAWERESVCVRE